MGWQWHQLDHMQIICTSLQTDNHASTSPLSFLQARSCRQKWREKTSGKPTSYKTDSGNQMDIVSQR